jgi:hypothetical protein
VYRLGGLGTHLQPGGKDVIQLAIPLLLQLLDLLCLLLQLLHAALSKLLQLWVVLAAKITVKVTVLGVVLLPLARLLRGGCAIWGTQDPMLHP